MSENIAAAIAAKNAVIAQQGEALDEIATLLETKAAGGDKWELINEVTIAESAEESNRISFTQDSSGNAFALKKALIMAGFPKYTGSSTIPSFSFASINNKQLGNGGGIPLAYTGAWNTPSTTKDAGTVWIVDVSTPIWKEESIKDEGGTMDTTRGNRRTVTNLRTTPRVWYCVPNQIGTITEIGGTNMLIYPGCWFALYGVRA